MKWFIGVMFLIIVFMLCGYGLGYVKGKADMTVIVKIELNQETLNSALYYHGLNDCTYDGTFYFEREDQHCDLFNNNFRSWYASKKLEEGK